MALFAEMDVASADEDPFGLPLGRSEATITASEETHIGKEGGEQFRVWKLEFTGEHNKHTDLLLFLDGADADKQKLNDGKIKAALIALEIPRERWGAVSNNPGSIVGTRVVVNTFKRGARKAVEIKGVAKGEPIPVGALPTDLSIAMSVKKQAVPVAAGDTKSAYGF